MANEKNLKPCGYKLSREEAKKGGKNSVKSRREKKTIQKLITDYLDKNVKDNAGLQEIAQAAGIDGKDSVKKLFTVVCLLNTLKEGDLNDLEKLMKLIGEETAADTGVIQKLDEVLKGIDDIAKQ